MNWAIKQTWVEEDRLFSSKLKIDNKISWERPHIIGSIFSHKMHRCVDYHSLNELIFYYLLELDSKTIRYYPQPVVVPVSKVLNAKGETKIWNHVPDVLFFRQGLRPQLVQIKEPSAEHDSRFTLVNQRCEVYCAKQGWGYWIAYPKEIPEVVVKNLSILIGFVKTRKTYATVLDDLFKNLKVAEGITINDLARCSAFNINPLQVIPAVYHLIATGIAVVNLYEPINQYTSVLLNRGEDIYGQLFSLEGRTYDTL